MKRFLEIVVQMKAAACLCLSASVCVLIGAAWLLGWDSVPLDMLFSVVLAGAVAGVFQVLAFTEVVFKRMAYTWRMVLFALPFLAVLSAIAFAFSWFPPDRAGSWGIFLAIFLITFFWVSAGFEIFFHLAGKKYDGLLGQYRKNREHTE